MLTGEQGLVSLDRRVKPRRKTRPAHRIFANGEAGIQGTEMGEMKRVKKIGFGLFGRYEYFVNKYVAYPEPDVIKDRVPLGGGGSVNIYVPPAPPPPPPI